MTFEVPEEIESLITAFVTREKRIQSRADELAVHSRRIEFHRLDHDTDFAAFRILSRSF